MHDVSSLALQIAHVLLKPCQSCNPQKSSHQSFTLNKRAHFYNKVFIITGGVSGIGLATASNLLNAGAQLVACNISESGLSTFLRNVAEDQNGRIFLLVVDITDQAAVESFLLGAKYKFGKVDGIASIAGTAGRQLSLRRYERLLITSKILSWTSSC